MSTSNTSIEIKLNIQQGDFSLHAELELPGKGVTAFFGPSGSGKTTLLRAIAGLDSTPGCSIKVDGECWQDSRSFIPSFSRPIAYIFQEPCLFSHLNVKGNLDYGLKRARPSDKPLDLDALLQLLGIENLLDRNIQTLSGGEQQRVAIARALTTNPKLLLMDEPLAALDQKRKDEILPFLESLHKELEIPIFYVTHSTDEVARIADHLVLLRGGRVLDSGPVREMLTRLDLPLAHRPDAEVLINATVVEVDKEFNLTTLAFGSQHFIVPRNDLPLNKELRLRLAAQDVSITLQAQQQTSIQNIFAATVTEIKADTDSQALVKLNIGNEIILARLTRKSIHTLKLEAGKQVFAQVKSVAVLA